MTDQERIPDLLCHCGAATDARAKVAREADLFYVVHICRVHCCPLHAVSLVARRWNANDDSYEGQLAKIGGVV